MHDDLSHLPDKQQGELVRVKRVLLDEFEKAVSLGTQPWKRGGKILKIILFGSYARDNWVDEPDNGYQSDFDLLIVVSHEKLTDIADYWYVAEEKILHDETIERPVNIIVHDLNEVNQALKRGEYFWAEIVRDGITLYELPNHPFATAVPATRAAAIQTARRHFDKQLGSTDEWLDLARHATSKGQVGDWPSKAAFNLHQAAETAYACYLLTSTFYFPRSHNIKFLRGLAEGKDERLAKAWPRGTKPERRRFELLKRAYVEARYSPNYTISAEDLDSIYATVTRLRDIVETVCAARIAELSRP